MVQVYQGDTAFMIQDEIPDYMSPFIDDVPLESPTLCTIDYKCGCKVILAVYTSNIAVGYILLQVGKDSKC
jgi:hypothetical protein